jgi:uncharacterized membrane-anchored protein YitT (DUF2179 family)
MSIKLKAKQVIYEYIGLMVGALIMALALVFFLIPAKIAPGGVSGLAIVLNVLYGLPVGVVMLLFNVPLYLMGLKLLGKTFGVRTLFAFIWVSIFTDGITELLGKPVATTEPLLASIFGGVILGIGLGVVFRYKGTTAGSDIVGQIINKYTNVSVGIGIMFVDFFVITLAGIAFKDVNLALYGFISLYFSSKVLDLILDGFDYARSFHIISEKQDEIIELITKDMNRGGTELKGTGFYTRQARNVLYTVVTRREVATLRQEILKIDPRAFVIISNVHEVLGEGFRKRI